MTYNRYVKERGDPWLPANFDFGAGGMGGGAGGAGGAGSELLLSQNQELQLQLQNWRAGYDQLFREL